MNDNNLQDYIKAGKGVVAAKKLARQIIKPGQTGVSYHFPSTCH
jgi:hypothetical protein